MPIVVSRVTAARRRLALSMSVALALAVLLPINGQAPLAPKSAHAAAPAWLDRMNMWRAIAKVPAVTENTTWSAGDYNHARYMVKNDIVTHYETAGTPYYTVAGDTAARNSNLNVNSTTSQTDVQAIDWWMQAPIHAMGIVDPRLTSTGFGSYREAGPGWEFGAALDVGRGNSFTGGAYPVFFPGNGTTMPLTSHDGLESPEPLAACSGYTRPSGLPVFVMVGGYVDTTISGVHSFTGDGVALAHCVVDSHNASIGSYLKSRGAAMLIPKAPLVPGVRYVVSMTVNAKPYQWSFTVGPFNPNDPMACKSANLAAAPASPGSIGPSVTFTATSTGTAPGCAAPEYKFFTEAPGGSWTAQTGYGANTWTWNTTGLKGGVYGVGVWARQTGSYAAYEAYWLGTYTLAVSTCTAATLDPATASPQPAGTSVTFNAAATRCPNAQFKFFVKAPGGTFVMQRDWGAASWTWPTTGRTAGTYELAVWARQPGSSKSYDAYGFTTYVIGSGTCKAATLTPGVAAPQAPGASIQFTASSNGCASPLYQFWLAPSGSTKFAVMQPYSASTTWTWNTTGATPGTYQVGVWAKPSGSTSSYSAYYIGTYQLDVGQCTAAAITASPASPQTAGTSITFTATAAGCSNAQFEFWRVSGTNENWKAVQAYGPGTTWTWNTTNLGGPYRIGVWVRQNGSAARYDSYAILTYWVSG